MERTGNIKLLGCWAHVRRKFMDVIKAKSNAKKSGLADEAVTSYPPSFMPFEKYARENKYDAKQIYELRQEKSKPILDEIGDWLNKNSL